MSIYFVHFFSAFISFSLLCAFFCKKFALKNLCFDILIGVVFAYIANFIAVKNLMENNLFFIANILLVITMICLVAIYFIRTLREIPLVFDAILTLLIFGFFVRYMHISADFKIFSSEVLDSLAINSFAFVILALIACGIALYLARILKNLTPKLSLTCGIIVFICTANAALADITLRLVRLKALEPTESLMSYIGKSVYYAFLNPYIFVSLLLILGIASLFLIPRNVRKNGLFDIAYRKALGIKNGICGRFALNVCVFAASVGVLLYYDLYASKPMAIDPPIVLERPSGGVFTFEANALSDNELHRYAYITDDGKEIRFFLLNKFEDRISPAVAFDACALCGDMGYVKKGGELICIACNVRIFLPSVGKFGGCNPIPLAFENDGGVIKVKLQDVLGGANYFSKVVSKSVKDPVNGATLLNTEALYRYEFNGITYFFSSQENYDAFVKEPEKYAPSELHALYRIQKYHDEIGNDSKTN